jgi:SAM-dependent methyltransferase
VGVVRAERALLDTQQAFDAVASSYDRSNTENRTLSDMRERVRSAVSEAVAPNAHLLDLGCGPGADVVHFANRGHQVTAIDWSPAMVRESHRRVSMAGLSDAVAVHHLGIQELDRLPPGRFDAAYSNFGPLNCVPDLATSARLIASRIRRGGVIVASVIGRVCPWELSLYLARGDWSRATVRFRGGPVPVPLDGRQVWTSYYTPARFARTFADAGFSTVSLRALGLFAPPPYLQAFADRHRTLVTLLQRIDDVVGGWPGMRACGDHFLIVMERSS